MMSVATKAPPPESLSTSALMFTKLVRERAELAAEWLRKSILAHDGKGSATYYSRFTKPSCGWAWPYPETTGYIIETLFEYADYARRADFAELAIRQAEWILTLQDSDGALPGGWVARGQKAGPSIFNTGQMIFGLLAAWDRTNRQEFAEAARRAATWLARGIDAKAGIWTAHSYVAGYSPAYYSRVAWPMLEVEKRFPDAQVRAEAIRVLNTISDWQLPNGAFRNWGFKPAAPAFTHTIAYTIRGLLESAELLGPDGQRFETAAYEAADVLRRKLELRGRLAGAYDTNWAGRFWYTCLTGNCQIAIIWARIFEQTNDARFLSAALKAVQFVIKKQRITALDPNVRGAISGSSPLWGRYLALRYPNWATKFYLQALLICDRNLRRLEECPPCASP